MKLDKNKWYSKWYVYVYGEYTKSSIIFFFNLIISIPLSLIFLPGFLPIVSKNKIVGIINEKIGGQRIVRRCIFGSFVYLLVLTVCLFFYICYNFFINNILIATITTFTILLSGYLIYLKWPRRIKHDLEMPKSKFKKIFGTK